MDLDTGDCSCEMKGQNTDGPFTGWLSFQNQGSSIQMDWESFRFIHQPLWQVKRMQTHLIFILVISPQCEKDSSVGHGAYFVNESDMFS